MFSFLLQIPLDLHEHYFEVGFDVSPLGGPKASRETEGKLQPLSLFSIFTISNVTPCCQVSHSLNTKIN